MCRVNLVFVINFCIILHVGVNGFGILWILIKDQALPSGCYIMDEYYCEYGLVT